MSILQDEDYIALPIPWLYEIICSDPPSHVFTAAVRSRTAASDFTPKKVRIELGRLIAAKDPLQNYFVVFLLKIPKLRKFGQRENGTAVYPSEQYW